MHPAILHKTCLAALVTLLLAGCATSPMGHSQLRLFSPQELSQMGAQAYDKIREETPESDDKTANALVNCVADALTNLVDGQWVVTVFKSKQVNAFALPGGKIGVYTGLLKVADTPDQLAAVLGHEIGHVLAHHSNARMSAQFATSASLQLLGAALGGGGGGAGTSPYVMSLLGLGAQVGVLLPYSRGQESEADLIGLKLMARAGFNPEAAVKLWHNMQNAGGDEPPEWLSTHPSSKSRIHALQQHMPEALQLYQQSSQHPDCG